MNPLMTVCDRHRKLIPAGETCPDCAAYRANQTRQRSANSNRELGRNTRHWRRLSGLARKLHPYCAICGRAEGDTPALKLTVDLIGGGSHATAVLEQTRVLHRSCHSRADGGNHRRRR